MYTQMHTQPVKLEGRSQVPWDVCFTLAVLRLVDSFSECLHCYRGVRVARAICPPCLVPMSHAGYFPSWNGTTTTILNGAPNGVSSTGFGIASVELDVIQCWVGEHTALPLVMRFLPLDLVYVHNLSQIFRTIIHMSCLCGAGSTGASVSRTPQSGRRHGGPCARRPRRLRRLCASPCPDCSRELLQRRLRHGAWRLCLYCSGQCVLECAHRGESSRWVIGSSLAQWYVQPTSPTVLERMSPTEDYIRALFNLITGEIRGQLTLFSGSAYLSPYQLPTPIQSSTSGVGSVAMLSWSALAVSLSLNGVVSQTGASLMSGGSFAVYRSTHA